MSQFFVNYKWLLITLACSVVGFFPLMGAPGILLMMGLDMASNVVHGRAYNFTPSYGDGFWPLGIVYSIVFPWIFFSIYLLLKKVGLQLSTFNQLLVTVVMTFVLALLGHGVYVYPAGYAAAYKQYSYQQSPAGKRLLLLQPLLAMQNDYFFTDQKLNANPQDISSEFLSAFAQAEKYPEQYDFKPDTLLLLQEAQKQLKELQKHPELLTEENLKTAQPWLNLRELIQKIEDSAELK